jgi:hypothetical protein
LKFLTSNGGDFNQGMWSRSANYGTFFRAYSGSTYDLLLSNSPQNVSMVLTAADARFLFGGNTGFYMDGTTGVVQITATPSGATSTEAATAAWTRNYVQTEIGMLQQTIAAGAYSTVQGDAGGHVYHASGAGAALYTIPNNATVAYQIGTTITFANDSATAITIAVQASDVLALSPAGTTGTRTLAQNGMATALKVTSTRWLISGTGLT